MIRLGVGEMIPEQWRGAVRKGFEGAYLEAVKDDGFYAILCMPNISEKEKETLRRTRINVRIVENDGMLLTLIRFGSTPLIFEFNFDPTLYPDDRALKTLGATDLMQIVGVDTKDLTIQALRLVSIPNRLIDEWRKSWTTAMSEDGFSVKYSSWINQLYQKWSTLQLWDRAIEIGRLGER